MRNFFFPIILFLIIVVFFSIITREYLSEKNVKKININRMNIEISIEKKSKNLPILKSDTSDVIEYNNGFNIEKNKPRKFWELIKKK